jgi:signal transduction histidine kinase
MDQATNIESPLFILFAAVIGMLLLALAVIFFFLVYQRRLTSQQNRIKNLELDYQKGLLQSILRAQETERKRIASDLHDSIGSTLSAIKLYVNQLKQSSTQTYFSELKQETSSLIDLTIDSIRLITQNLLPSSLEQFGLIAALEDLCKRINDIEFLEVNFFQSHDKRFEPHIEAALYRVVQELFNNTIKHAKASRIDLTITFEPDFLNLVYQDNGIGFNIGNWKEILQNSTGLGLKSIESRLNLLDAKLDFQSKPKEGTTIKIKVPIT